MNIKISKYKIILKIIICIILIGILVLISKSLKKSNNNENEVLASLDDKELSELYAMIPTSTREYNIYVEKKILAKDIPSEFLIVKVIELLDNYYIEEATAGNDLFDSNIDYDDYDTEEEYELARKTECLEKGGLIYNYDVCYFPGKNDYGHNAYKEETIKAYFSKFYGSDDLYKTIDFVRINMYYVYYVDGYYVTQYGGGYAYPPVHHTQFIKLETTKNEKYLYVKYLYESTTCDDELENCVTEVFTNANKTNKLGEHDYDYSIDYFDLYEDDAVVYKHTYKKNSDGSYYWYSVEPVK